METHFDFQTNKLPMLQKLVKRFKGRFINNPLELFGDKSRVSLNFENIQNANKFGLMKFIIEQPFF